MHTPVEEHGLRARRLQSRVEAAFRRLGGPDARAVLGAVRDASQRRGLTYVRTNDAGEVEIDVIRSFATPVVIVPEQLAYVHSVSMALLSSMKRMRGLYLRDPDVRRVLQLPKAEEEWLVDAHESMKRHDPLFARLDAVVDFALPHWQASLQFVEPNLSGVGGLHLLPTSEQICADIVVPHLQSADLRLERGADIRDLLLQELVDHLAGIGRPAGGAAVRTVALIEPRERTPGPEEQELVQAHYRARFGVEVLHLDPRDLCIEGDEVKARGRVVDVAYRDYAVSDLLALATETGCDLAPIRRLFRENRIVSSLGAELDQKSIFEVLTDPDLLERHFDADEREVFAAHIPWTRLLRPRDTLLPDATTGDLQAFVRGHRSDLVLKPNRSYGGYGVVVGHAVDDDEWRAAVDAALAIPDSCVVQARVSVPVYPLPIEADDGVQWESCFVVMGFAPSRHGLAILGRASVRPVVNVAQRGGVVPVMIAHGAKS